VTQGPAVFAGENGFLRDRKTETSHPFLPRHPDRRDMVAA
jgi:hypothetical protein